MGSSASTINDVRNSGSKAEESTEIVDVKMESNGKEIIDVKTVSKEKEPSEITKGEMGINGSTSLDVKTVSKGEDYINTANGETIPRTTTIHDAKNTTLSESKNNQISEIRKPTAGEISYSQSMRTNVATSRKKLLILDVNGLLADVIYPPPKDCKSDINILKRAIFKRHFLDDFLGFCFERFDVAIWSSRTRKILDPLVDYLLGDLKKRLLYFWDLSHCTNSSARCLENKHKSIVFKELRKIWEVNEHYNESNTLLLDDSPYKALLNPKHTGIFPLSYSYKDTNDNFLGPDGDLQVYLEGVAASENVKMYVEQHPFGQRAIDETNMHWAFYSKVLKDVCRPRWRSNKGYKRIEHTRR